jgi:hypothetical protein
VLLTKYFSGNRIKEDEIGGACSTYGEKINAYTALLGKSEGKRPIRRAADRLEDNIKMDVK